MSNNYCLVSQRASGYYICLGISTKVTWINCREYNWTVLAFVICRIAE